MRFGLLQLTPLCLFLAGGLSAAPCITGPLDGYLNGGAVFNCTDTSGAISFFFNHDILPTYVGLNLLGSNNSSVAPTAITVAPGSGSLSFQGIFSSSGAVLSSQAELIHFLATSSSYISGTTFSLSGVSTSTGGLGIGTGLAIGQELVCVGGTFTSLPVGLVTTVTNGILPNGQFGCNGTALIGTAASSSGPLNALTSVLGLPNLTGVTDSAVLTFSQGSTTVDVIKLQALLTVTGGTASTTGFGNSFTLTPTPEPSTMLYGLAGICALALGKSRKRTETHPS